MILRLSQKLNTKIKGDLLAELPLDTNPYWDWSCNLFMVGRSPVIIWMNTASFYSCLMPGQGITNSKTLLSRGREAIREYMTEDGLSEVFDKFFNGFPLEARSAKSLNRTVVGSMNDLTKMAKWYLAEDVPFGEVSRRINQTPMTALTRPNGEKYDRPRSVFERLADRIIGETRRKIP